MRIEIPVLIESVKSADQRRVHHVCPLFHGEPSRSGEDLGDTLSKLASDLGEHLRALARHGRHMELSDYSFSPKLTLIAPTVRLDLRGREFSGVFPLVVVEGPPRLACVPRLGQLWFEAGPIREAAGWAGAALERHFRELQKHCSEEDIQEELAPFKQGTGKFSIRPVRINVDPRQDFAAEEPNQAVTLAGAARREGGAELRSVGRSLDELYPDNLQRAFGREPIVDEVRRLLEAADCRPVLLVGRTLVGKTAVVHEVVRRRVEARVKRSRFAYHGEEGVWLLGPQRLISGMVYLGQWQQRLLAILAHAEHQDHVLYFDDFLGLFSAGITERSKISAAMVLKPFLERRQVRVLAEMTPERFRVFRERDRGLADLFQVVRLEEPSEAQTLAILLEVMRRIESRYQVRFALDALPTVLELTRRYERSAAQPGKAACWLAQLALKHRDAALSGTPPELDLNNL